MNVPRGLFRLWLVVSLIWISALIAFKASDYLKPDIKEGGKWGVIHPGDEFMISFLEEDSPYVKSLIRSERSRVEVYDFTEYPDFIFILEVRSPLKPDQRLKMISEAKANARKFTSTLTKKERRRIELQILTYGVVPIIILLITGSAVIWAFSGFRRDV